MTQLVSQEVDDDSFSFERQSNENHQRNLFFYYTFSFFASPLGQNYILLF